MKIAFLGNFKVPYTSENHYLRTLRKLGHEVMPLQEGIDDIQTILSRATKMDMFFWVHTHGWHTEGMREGLSILKDKGIPTVGYHLDLWLGIKRQKDLETDPYWDIDYFFSVDKLMVDFLNSREDMPKAFYLPAGVFEDECYIGEYDKSVAHDIIFVGSRAYHPEWSYREKLISWLEKTYGNKFALYGRDGLGVKRGDDLNRLYASSKIVVGDTLCQGFNYPYYLSDRVFETTGRGGFMIHPFIEGLQDLFNLSDYLKDEKGHYRKNEGREIVAYPFNDFEYLKYAIDYFLKNEAEREKVRQAGHIKTRLHHTYTSRLKYLIDTVKDEQSRK